MSPKKSQVTFQSSTVSMYWKFTTISKVLQKSPCSRNRLRHFYQQGSHGTLLSTNKHARIILIIVTLPIVRVLILCDISLFFINCKAHYLTSVVDDKLPSPSGHKFSSFSSSFFTCSFNGNMATFNTNIFWHLTHVRPPNSYLLQFACH